MAYATYTTQALVCGTFDRNTADRSYRLFTRELGMVWADARSVRLEKSKQRSALTDFSVVRISLVRGKAGWKIGSVIAQQNFYHQAVGQAARGHVRDLVRVVRRFVQGEEPAPELYDFVSESLEELAQVSEAAAFVYDVIFLRVLLTLGYVSKGKVAGEVQQGRPAELAALAAPELHATIKQLIAHGESASHL